MNIQRITKDHNLYKYIDKNIKCLNNLSIYREPAVMPKRIVAIGDIHGDFEALITILYDSRIIDISGNWIANDTFLVQTGDLFDKTRMVPVLNDDIILKNGDIFSEKYTHSGKEMPIRYLPDFGNPDDELVILGYLTDLHNEATNGSFGNSRVILCLGNHELMNAQLYYTADVERYIHPSQFELFGGPSANIRSKIFEPSVGNLAVKLACIYKICVVIGDFIFMHGGINDFNFQNIKTIDDIDKLNINILQHFMFGAPLDDEISHPEYGLLWYRGLSDDRRISRSECSRYNKLIRRIGERDLTLVVGHTPNYCDSYNGIEMNSQTTVPLDLTKSDNMSKSCNTRIKSACGKRVYRIDTIMSRAFGSPDYRKVQVDRLNALEINIDRDGHEKGIYNIKHGYKTDLIEDVDILQ